jgi:hypothetical protein
MAVIRGTYFSRSLMGRGTAWGRSKLMRLRLDESKPALTGCSLAYHEMKLTLASVLFSFHLELCPESEGWTNQETYFLWVKGPLMLKLKPVN